MDWTKTLKKVGFAVLYAAIIAAVDQLIPTLKEQEVVYAALLLPLLVALRDWAKHRKD